MKLCIFLKVTRKPKKKVAQVKDKYFNVFIFVVVLYSLYSGGTIQFTVSML